MMGSCASARAFAVLRHLKRLEEMLAYRGEAGIFQFHQGNGAGEGGELMILAVRGKGVDCPPFTMEAGTTATPTPEAAHIRLVRASSLTQRYSGWGWGNIRPSTDSQRR